MKLDRLLIFKSVPNDCYFVGPRMIQSSLGKICDAWINYLQEFVNQTETLFTNPELPWDSIERPLVSSLAVALTRRWPNSLAIEEWPIPKIGRARRGRCDLWATIPDRSCPGGRFNFYLEAKKSRPVFSKTAEELSEFLRKGVGRLYRALGKTQRSLTNKFSAYIKCPSRVHEHYIIGLLVTRLSADKHDSATIKRTLREVFENEQTVVLRKRKRKKDLGRLPTLAMVVLPDNGKPGMIASFTVFGASPRFIAKQHLRRAVLPKR